MSASYNRNRKDRKARRTLEEKDFARKVKAGLLPRFIFKKVGEALERRTKHHWSKSRGGLTLTLTAWPKTSKESS